MCCITTASSQNSSDGLTSSEGFLKKKSIYWFIYLFVNVTVQSIQPHLRQRVCAPEPRSKGIDLDRVVFRVDAGPGGCGAEVQGETEMPY